MGMPPPWKDAVGRAFQREFAAKIIKETNMPTGIPPLYEVQELPAMPEQPSLRKVKSDVDGVDATHFQFLTDANIPEAYHYAVHKAMARATSDLRMRNRGLEADLNGMCHSLTTEQERVKVMARAIEEQDAQHLRTVTILVQALQKHAPDAYGTLLMQFLK